MKTLVICPTKNRPDLCQQMLKSFKDTITEDTKIIFTLEEDENKYQEYKNLFSLENVTFFECPPKNLTSHINDMVSIFPDYDFYMIINDDVIFNTKGWDKALTSKKGINYGNDLLQGSTLPTFPCVSAEIVRSLGYIQSPFVERYYGDTILNFIGRETKCLNYFPAVQIEHIHYLNKKRIQDSSDTNMEEDMINFAKWIQTQSKADINKVRSVL